MKKIETEEHRRVVAAERMSAQLANLCEVMPEPGEARWRAVEEWLGRHPEVVVGAPEDAQEAYKWELSQPHSIPLSDNCKFLTVLNTSILTDWGTYDYRPLSLDEARGIYSEMWNGPQMVQSAVGHTSTARILCDLIGEGAGLCNRVEYKQPIGARALVFKLRGRPPEGVILSREEVEVIGYDLGLLTRIS